MYYTKKTQIYQLGRFYSFSRLTYPSDPLRLFYSISLSSNSEFLSAFVLFSTILTNSKNIIPDEAIPSNIANDKFADSLV